MLATNLNGEHTIICRLLQSSCLQEMTASYSNESTVFMHSVSDSSHS